MADIRFFNVKFTVGGKTVNAKIEEGISIEDVAGNFKPVKNNECKSLPNYRFKALEALADGYNEPGLDGFVLSKKDIEAAQEKARKKTLEGSVSKFLPNIYKVKDVKASENSVEMYITDGKDSKSNLKVSSNPYTCKVQQPKPQVKETQPLSQTKAQTKTNFPVIKTTLNKDEKEFSYNGSNWRCPVEPAKGDNNVVITSHFQKRRELKGHKTRPHTGWDIRAKVGTEVKSIADGVVTVAKKDGITGYGAAVFIEHTNNNGKKVVSEYGHLSAVNVKHGQKVKQGEVIGKSGGAKWAPGSGISEAPHLHLTIREIDAKGTRIAVAPNKYIKTYD